MSKVRVYQLAKELKVQSALILELLDRMGRDVKSDLSVLDASTADVVRTRVTSAIETEKKRIEEERVLQAQQEAERVQRELEEEAVTPAPVEEEKAPVAAEPAQPPAAPVEPKPKVVPAARPPVTPSAAAASAPAAGSTLPGGRQPRVFPARRIPVAGTIPGRARPSAPTPPARVPSMGRPVPPMTTPGRSVPPAARRRRKRDKPAKREVATPAAVRPKQELPPVPATIMLSEGVTVKELAEKLNRKSKDVIAKLIQRGVLATINQPLEPATAIEVAKEFGAEASILTFEEEAQKVAASAVPQVAADSEAPTEVGMLVPRPPVVTVMGHVDHGKTSLLDALRATRIADKEAGGITQHIGAYQIDIEGRKITFLDTPGHEAFTLMRARGAKATDIVVLVVAADDGVKPQTLEAIDHAKAADVPIVVAINKIDKANAHVDRVKKQLADADLLIEEFGGAHVACEVSAKKGTGLSELLEMILLVADLRELKADPSQPAAGVVLEAELDRARGVLATVLVQSGTLSVGDSFIAGAVYGKVRAMTDEQGRRVDEASPSTPVEVMGLAAEPMAGDIFQAVADEAKARQIAAFRQERIRAQRQRQTARRTLESLAHDIATGEIKELPILLKADVQGSLEALQQAVSELPSDKVRVKILRTSIGAISQADVLLAAASNAIVVGFNVRPDKTAAEVAVEEDVELRLYTVIYNLIDELKQAMLGLLEPTFKEVVLGQAEVKQLFRVPKVGTIAGCYVSSGKVKRNAEVRLVRDNVVVYNGKVGSLRRFKDDVAEVKQGQECGIGIANYNDVKEGDTIEFFVTEAVAAKSL